MLLFASQILFGGFLETLSLCYITVVVLTVVPINPAAIVLLMCSLSMIPAIWEVFKSRSRWRTERGKFASIMFGSSAVFALIGIVLLLLKVFYCAVLFEFETLRGDYFKPRLNQDR